jgi:hypothetical protein
MVSFLSSTSSEFKFSGMKRKQIWSELHKPTQMPSSLGIADSTWNSFQSVPAMLLAAKSGSGHLPVLSRFGGECSILLGLIESW